MSDQDDNETQGIVFAVLGFVVAGVIALVAGLAIWKSSQSAQPAVPPAAEAPAAVVAVVEESDIAPVGEALAKVYFAVGSAALNAEDQAVVAKTVEALAAQAEAIVLLSGFHDESGDPAMNAELAKQRALAVREALVAGGVAVDRVKLRKPESTVGTGSPEEGRRVEIRVQ
ncbi:MAG: OmpA family protein [Azonexus sp.]|nr:OmpA family protein [Azonexus sp.]